MIGITIAVVGLFAVIAWNAVLPDRRDALVLGPLPVRLRTIFLAKAAAITTALGVSVGAVNVFTGLAVPFVAGAEPARALAAYWLTMIAAGVLIFSGLLAAQGIAAQIRAMWRAWFWWTRRMRMPRIRTQCPGLCDE